jgi:hypothetical protein
VRLPVALIAIAVVILVVVASSGNGSERRTTRPSTTVTTPSDPVIRQIQAMTSCPELQDWFDMSYEYHQHATSNNATRAMKNASDRMRAADSRMREIGCYR